MSKQAPTIGRLASMVIFALSCFGLLLFLWTSFGGPSPLKPQGYRFQVSFDEATQLASTADVRISGVPVGRVVGLERSTGRTLVTIEMDAKYAPVRRDARAILRLKTLLGETFVEMTPGSPDAPPLPEGGRLPVSNVQPTVELDEVLRVFDKETRDDFKQFFTGMAGVFDGRGRDLNDALGNAAPALRRGTSLLSILDAQERAVSHGIRDTGRVFGALGRRQSAVATLVDAGDKVLDVTARRDNDLERLFGVLPTFQAELRATLDDAEGLLQDARPVVRALRPVAPKIEPLLTDTARLAPDLRRLFREVDPVITLSRTGLPALSRTVRAAAPLMKVLEPLSRDLIPVAEYLGLYRREVAQMWMNTSAATNAVLQNPGAEKPIRYLRALVPIHTEAFVTAPRRLPSNRTNPYPLPGGLENTGELKSFSCSHTSNPQTLPVLGSFPRDCTEQGPITVGGRTARFPRLERAPSP